MPSKQSKASKERAVVKQLKELLGIRLACELLESELEGLYDEMDKLAKKAPTETVTNLQLRVVNSFVQKAKKLLAGDTIIDEITVFVAAGDNPEYRDVITVLRQIKQGLERFRGGGKYSYLWEQYFENQLSEHEIEDEEATPFFTAD